MGQWQNKLGEFLRLPLSNHGDFENHHDLGAGRTAVLFRSKRMAKKNNGFFNEDENKEDIRRCEARFADVPDMRRYKENRTRK